MTRFQDGPAAGKVLHLARAPVYLRVVRGPDGAIDALDQLDDAPEPGEEVFAYEKASDDGTVHVDGRDPRTGRRFGRWYACATYRLCAAQPDDATARSVAGWPAWCRARHAERQAAEKGG